jgi:hypothetical protein
VWIAFLVYLVLAAIVFGWLIPSLGGAPPWEAATPARGWYDYLDSWQTGIGALVGILGLVVVEAVSRWLEPARRAGAPGEAAGDRRGPGLGDPGV